MQNTRAFNKCRITEITQSLSHSSCMHMHFVSPEQRNIAQNSAVFSSALLYVLTLQADPTITNLLVRKKGKEAVGTLSLPFLLGRHFQGSWLVKTGK